MAKAKWNGDNQEQGILVILCPAGHMHYIHTKSKNGQGYSWSFNGDMDFPTLTPSVNERTGHYVDPTLKDNPKVDPEWLKENSYHCHFILTSGVMRFCGDCSHELKNQSVPLPDIS